MKILNTYKQKEREYQEKSIELKNRDKNIVAEQKREWNNMRISWDTT